MSDLQFLLVANCALVAAFVVAQLFTRAGPVLFGCSRGFAIGAMTVSLVASLCIAVLVGTTQLGWLSGMEGLPFVSVYSIGIFSFLLIPALLIIEGIVVVELSTSLKECTPRLRQWHMAAALCCIAWFGVAVVARASN